MRGMGRSKPRGALTRGRGAHFNNDMTNNLETKQIYRQVTQ
jgi:hypothetical protein